MQPDIRLVVIDNFYAHADDPLAKELFGHLVSIKIKAYKNSYGYGNIPFDKDDLFSTHLIACEVVNGKLIPFTAYKAILHSRCKAFEIPFSFKEMIHKTASESCKKEFDSLMEKCQNEGDEIAYLTSWAMDPDIDPSKKVLRVLTRDISTSLLLFHHKEFNIRYWLTFGMVDVKTDRFFIRTGAKPISDDPYIIHPTMRYTENGVRVKDVKAMAISCDINEYTEYTYQTSEKYLDLWKNRIQIG